MVKSIGKGAFGEIFQCDDLETDVQIAVKTEKLDSKKRVLKIEVAVLKKLQACPFVCRYQQFGRHEEFHFVVMELLGENLSVLRKRQPGKRFSVGTTMRLGMQMVRAIEGMHDHGYLHRDIKPSNFAMGRQPDNRDWCFLIDFGLARRYVLPSGDIRTARESAGFRGTARYASINSHLSKELSRRDDMWSLLYMIIEFLKGSLPWSNIENKEDVGRHKIELDSLDLVSGLPPEMGHFMEHLRTLEYKDKPNYDYITDLFNQIMEKQGIMEDEPYDWEVKDSNRESRSAPRDKHREMEAWMNAPEGVGHPDDRKIAKGRRGSATQSRRPKAEPKADAQVKAKRSARDTRPPTGGRREGGDDPGPQPMDTGPQRMSPHDANGTTSRPPAEESSATKDSVGGSNPGQPQVLAREDRDQHGGGCRCVIS